MRELGDQDDQRGRNCVRGRLRQDLRRPNGEERAISEEADMYGLLDLRQRSGLVRRGQWPARYEPLDVALDRRTSDEHAVLARRTAQADVRTQADDAPRVTTARMRLTQGHDVIEIEQQRAPRLGRHDARLGHRASLAARVSEAVSQAPAGRVPILC